MRVLVCGGRTFGVDRHGNILEQAYPLFDALEDILERYGGQLVVIEGGARGADALAALWAADRGVQHLQFPADWDRHGSAAGSIRNLQMILEGKPDLVLAAPGGPGTRNMIKQAKQHDIEVRCLL